MKALSSLDAVRSAVRVSLVREPATTAEEEMHLSPLLMTISRQTGTNAANITGALVAKLNELDPGDHQWLDYDHRLVDQVAQDHDLSEELVNRLGERDISWIEHFMAGFTGSTTGTDVAMKIAQTIRGLAIVGRAIIVGRGGQCVLAGIPNVIHVRLVAPLPWRVQQYVELAGVSENEAQQTVKQSDRDRERFVHNHFKQDISDPDLYHLIINVATMSIDEITELLSQYVYNRMTVV